MLGVFTIAVVDHIVKKCSGKDEPANESPAKTSEEKSEPNDIPTERTSKE